MCYEVPTAVVSVDGRLLTCTFRHEQLLLRKVQVMLDMVVPAQTKAYGHLPEADGVHTTWLPLKDAIALPK